MFRPIVMMLANRLPDAEVVDPFEGCTATAADDGGAIAADERIGGDGVALGAIKFGAGIGFVFGHYC